jgi:hypothetical protein
LPVGSRVTNDTIPHTIVGKTHSAPVGPSPRERPGNDYYPSIYLDPRAFQDKDCPLSRNSHLVAPESIERDGALAQIRYAGFPGRPANSHLSL